MLAFLLSLSLSKEVKYEYPPITIYRPVITVDQKPVVVINSLKDVKKKIKPYVGSEAAEKLSKKIVFSKTAGTELITINAGMGRKTTREFNQENVIAYLRKESDEKIIFKMSTVVSRSDVLSEIVKKTVSGTKEKIKNEWRPLDRNELKQIYDGINNEAGAIIDREIANVRKP